MAKQVASDIKLYHIVHIDRLSSIIKDGFLWSDAEINMKKYIGPTIGMKSIKKRRMNQPLTSFPDLHVGECVPFYFCPRSVMLYLFYMNNHPDVTYKEGQEPIIHLVADLCQVVKWAAQNEKRWVFTDSNAGSYYFNDYYELSELSHIDWSAVKAHNWQSKQDKKQAEFLIENHLPFQLIESIGVYSMDQFDEMNDLLTSSGHKPPVMIKKEWYY